QRSSVGRGRRGARGADQAVRSGAALADRGALLRAVRPGVALHAERQRHGACIVDPGGPCAGGPPGRGAVLPETVVLKAAIVVLDVVWLFAPTIVALAFVVPVVGVLLWNTREG